MNRDMNTDAYFAFMMEASWEASKQSLPYFRGDCKVIEKKHHLYSYDPVTQADKAVESYFRKQVEIHFPDHGIEGEEYGISKPDSPWRWIIDPIDGTRYFMTGLTGWATLVGLLYEGQPIMGTVVQPFTQEAFYGDRHTAFWSYHNKKKQIKAPVAVSSNRSRSLKECIVMTYSPDSFKEHEKDAFALLTSQTKAVFYGSDCFSFIMACMGYIDIVVEANLQRYDIVPLLPIIEGAGGKYSQWNGKSALEAGNVIVSPYENILYEAQKILHP